MEALKFRFHTHCVTDTIFPKILILSIITLIGWIWPNVIKNFSTHSSLWSQLKIKYWSLLRQRPLFSFTPQYTNFNTFKYINHFETVTILSSTSGLGSSAFLLNFNNTVNYENFNMLVWQLEDIFSTAQTNLCDWLRMLCLRESDHVWTDLVRWWIVQTYSFIQGFHTMTITQCSYLYF